MGFKKNGVRKKVGVKKNVPIIFFLMISFANFLQKMKCLSTSSYGDIKK